MQEAGLASILDSRKKEHIMNTSNQFVTASFWRRKGPLTAEAVSYAGRKDAILELLEEKFQLSEKESYESVDITLSIGAVRYEKPIAGTVRQLLETRSLHRVGNTVDKAGPGNIFTFAQGKMDSRHLHQVPKMMRAIQTRIDDLRKDIESVKYGPGHYTTESEWAEVIKKNKRLKKFLGMLQMLSTFC